jgi:hypothetical protein
MDDQRLYDAREIAQRLGLHLRTVQMLLTFPYLPQGDHRGGFALEWA